MICVFWSRDYTPEVEQADGARVGRAVQVAVGNVASRGQPAALGEELAKSSQQVSLTYRSISGKYWPSKRSEITSR